MNLNPIFLQIAEDPVKSLNGLDFVINLLMAEYGWAGAVLTWVGMLRILVKPAMSVWFSIVKSTPSEADDLLYEKVSKSPAFTFFIWLLDYLVSFKAIHPKTINENDPNKGV